MKIAIVLLSAFALAQSAAIDDVSPYLDGGPVATAGQFPWHVQIVPVNVNANFSGILIAPNWVLTCAACINKSPIGHDLIFGALDLDNDAEPNRITRSIGPDDVITFPDYDPSQFNVNNIALIKLPEPIVSSFYVGYIGGLGEASSTYEGDIARISGFGFESTSVTSGQQLLRYTDLNISPDSECRNLETGQMCATLVTPETGPCRDEGSALYVSGTAGTGVAIGIFSYGYAEGGCPGSTTLFTRVSNYREWIDSTINGASSTTPAVSDTTPAVSDTTAATDTTAVTDTTVVVTDTTPVETTPALTVRNLH